MNSLNAFKSLFHGRSNANYDVPLVYCIILLIGVGFVMVTSASMPTAIRMFDNPFYFAQRHLVYLVLSLLLLMITTSLPMVFWQKANIPLLLSGMGLLLAVLIIGKEINGSTRWIRFGLISIQASEVAKLCFFCYLAGYLVRKKTEVKDNLKGFIKPLFVLAVYAILIMMQPDLGTVVVMFVTTVGLLFLAGARLSQFFALMVMGLVLVVLLIAISPYRRARITGFLDPWGDPFDKGYQLVQSLMAYSRGDWFGQGLGNSVQKLQYLPEAHTDFIFSILAEETGFLGVVIVLVVLFTLIFRALNIGLNALKADKEYEGYLALGIAIWFAFQSMVNVGASAGILPTKGLTLPFVSYGGSSLLVMTVAVGILLRIDFETKMAVKQATVRGRKS
jgi:cell division protein FtsW